MNREFDMVRAFHVLAGHPVATAPTFLMPTRVAIRARWMTEEIDELAAAEEVVDQVDAIIDIIYFALGTLVELGVAPDTAFDIVHRSNIAKVDGSGPVHRDASGKVQKPVGWMDPRAEIKAYTARTGGDGHV
jgi:predicted HAD superfamily Cof-like phosphohydrolase